jgi:Glyoxalase-like domain
MARLSHVCLGVQNLYEGAHRLREETGLENYDGGWFRAGMANRIFPVGNDQYIEVESLIDRRMAERARGAEYFLDFVDYLDRETEDGDGLIGWCIRADSLDELRQIGQRVGFTLPDGPREGRIRPDGEVLRAYGEPPSVRMWPHGLPNFLYYPDPDRAPGMIPVEHRGVEPRGIAWLELGGDERKIRDWLGAEAADVPLRFVGGEPGIRAVGIATDNGEIVVRR